MESKTNESNTSKGDLACDSRKVSPVRQNEISRYG